MAKFVLIYRTGMLVFYSTVDRPTDRYRCEEDFDEFCSSWVISILFRLHYLDFIFARVQQLHASEARPVFT